MAVFDPLAILAKPSVFIAPKKEADKEQASD